MKKVIASALIALALVLPPVDMAKSAMLPGLALPTYAASSTVYWTEKGKCWHTTKGCSTLSRSKNIKSGTVQQAKDAGKTKACSKC